VPRTCHGFEVRETKRGRGAMVKRKKDKMGRLVKELIKGELEVQLTKMVRRTRKKAARELERLNQVPRLEYRPNEGFVEAEFQEVSPGEDGEDWRVPGRKTAKGKTKSLVSEQI
jgi:hypothetical protein